MPDINLDITAIMAPDYDPKSAVEEFIRQWCPEEPGARSRFVATLISALNVGWNEGVRTVLESARGGFVNLSPPTGRGEEPESPQEPKEPVQGPDSPSAPKIAGGSIQPSYAHPDNKWRPGSAS